MLKYKKRSNFWSNSTKSNVIFENEAFSYKWYRYALKITNTLWIVNDYGYSRTTSKHISEFYEWAHSNNIKTWSTCRINLFKNGLPSNLEYIIDTIDHGLQNKLIPKNQSEQLVANLAELKFNLTLDKILK
jgi:hypothetical protein